MDTNPLLVIHYNDLNRTHKKKISTLHNNSSGCKDDIMHCLNHSPPTSICPMFFKVFFTFKMQYNSLRASNSNFGRPWFSRWKIVAN